ncbi:hypothetical protein SCLCIDRAFT_1000988 [Scleroderma citrinum Foug A]|uniref:Uncharacterized protein n=1 Tax=Scleroderma citrinum Foug A TaxID=1036808 RepID=A0A0C3A352_9AGAM|nr:hypothetical protein SCLCIDRAFT_1000988 [Scleroderma citrinum Foug A]
MNQSNTRLRPMILLSLSGKRHVGKTFVASYYSMWNIMHLSRPAGSSDNSKSQNLSQVYLRHHWWKVSQRIYYIVAMTIVDKLTRSSTTFLPLQQPRVPQYP